MNNLSVNKLSKLFTHKKVGEIWIPIRSIVGKHVFIDKGSSITLPMYLDRGTRIGKYCALAGLGAIISTNHEYNCPTIKKSLNHRDFNFSSVLIENDVWIGSNVTILPGVHIGSGAIIGAGSVVTKDIVSYSISVGNPAKHIRYRFDTDIIKLLNEIKWWNWSEKKIKLNNTFFNADLNSMNFKTIQELIVNIK